MLLLAIDQHAHFSFGVSKNSNAQTCPSAQATIAAAVARVARKERGAQRLRTLSNTVGVAAGKTHSAFKCYQVQLLYRRYDKMHLIGSLVWNTRSIRYCLLLR